MNESGKKNSATVLMVESNVMVRMPVASFLRECGYRVIEACTTDEALIVLSQGALNVDVLLTDIQAQGSVEGFALAQWVRRERPNTKAIISGSPERVAKAAGQLCEDGPTLTTPYNSQLLYDQIRRLLAVSAG